MWPSGEWVKQILSHVPPTDPLATNELFQMNSDINPNTAPNPKLWNLFFWKKYGFLVLQGSFQVLRSFEPDIFDSER